MPFVWNVDAWGPRNHIMGIPHARERIVGGLYFGIPRFVCNRYCQSYSLHAVFEIRERTNRHTQTYRHASYNYSTPPPREGSDTRAKYLWDFDDRRARLSVKSCTNYARTRGSVHSMNGALFWRAVLTNWAHWAHAQGPRFFSFWGPPTGCGEINFLKLIILLQQNRPTVKGYSCAALG